MGVVVGESGLGIERGAVGVGGGWIEVGLMAGESVPGASVVVGFHVPDIDVWIHVFQLHDGVVLGACDDDYEAVNDQGLLVDLPVGQAMVMS